MTENKIILNRKEAERFFALKEAGVFDLDDGKAEVNCHDSHIKSIIIHKRTYKREAKNGKIGT